MSPARTDPPGVLGAFSSELRYGLDFLRRHPFRLLLPFVGVLLPLWLFAGMATELREGDVFFFDIPVLVWVHRHAGPQVDAGFQLLSQLGYLWGVVPADVLLLGWLAWRRRYRDGLFFGLAVLGSLALNIGAKAYFARTRPDLWLSLAPETTYSFPSGHAMGSATLAVAAALLAWNTSWRWPVAATGGLFVVLVGLSRVYLGVHFPSDLLAGWAAATAWVVAMYQLTASAPAPPASGAPRRDNIAPASAARSRD